jgi:uncharacterized membrane protein SpoIIM required for sporulation
MSEELILKHMQPVWQELARLLEKGRKGGPKKLNAEELSRLDRLYRQTTVHLAQIRSRTRNEILIRDLNRLVANAHSFVYIAPRRRPFSFILGFYLKGFPRVIVQTRYFHLLSFLLFMSGWLMGHLSFGEHPKAAYALIAPGDTRLRHGRDQGDGEKLIFATFLFTNNTKVGFMAFASGVLAAVPTVFIMLLNGAMLGTFSSIYYQKGISTEMWAWLLPHGITEILAVIFCGGAGLMLGLSVIQPGFRTRRQSLREAGKPALYVALGVVPMFLIAGMIESYVRQSHWDTPTRLTFAGGTSVILLIYFLNGYLLERKENLKALQQVPLP